jgi:hypothetical protein
MPTPSLGSPTKNRGFAYSTIYMSCLLPIGDDLRADRPGIHDNNISGAAELSKIGLEPSQLAMDDSIHVLELYTVAGLKSKI